MNAKEVVKSVLKQYPGLDVEIKLTEFNDNMSAGIRGGKIVVSVSKVQSLAGEINEPVNEVLEFILHHEIAHYRNGDRGKVIDEIKVHPGHIRRFSKLWVDFLQNEKNARIKAPQLRLSKKMDELQVKVLKEQRKASIAQLKAGYGVIWKVRK